ncbi:MAG: hypothetical protein NWR73_05025 [Flavobacteriales bacterium]|nr:hypothetical protein [Flavobacteriaceae bacterium]MDP4827024.1 hypothetical protein [Flavobacteriales bacterium]
MTRISILLFLLVFVACSDNTVVDPGVQSELAVPTAIVSNDYEIVVPAKQDALLVLFPCLPCNAENTKTEFNILDIALANNVAVLLMNYNQHLWMSETEKAELEKILVDAVSKHGVNTSNTYIGGFSGGGNVSLLLTDYLKSMGSSIQPKGVFIADSPIDLFGLYENAKKTIQKSVSETAVEEANWIVETFDAEFGVGDTALASYSKLSPYLSKTKAMENLSHLNGLKIRLYSEPDTLWWKENRQVDYEDMNACFIEKMAISLTELYGNDHLEYIKTTNKGYRANGDRHPHSWSIIDSQDLVNWMLSK